MTDTKRISRLSLLLSLSLVLSYIESLIPLFSFLPGLKLGLGNIVILYSLYRERVKDVALLLVLRITLSSLLFGTLLSFLYSLSGGVLSFFLMLFLKKTNMFSPLGVSVIGAVSHNVGQLLLARVLLDIPIFPFLPYMILFGILTGSIIGIFTVFLFKRMGVSYD